jgi:hypothetical protein
MYFIYGFCLGFNGLVLLNSYYYGTSCMQHFLELLACKDPPNYGVKAQ